MLQTNPAYKLFFAGLLGFTVGVPTLAQEFASKAALDELGVQRYWHTDFPLESGMSVDRAVLCDDAVYLLTNSNIAFATHSKTGVIRWTNLAAEPGQTLRGPTHSKDFVFFTGAASVKAYDRTTGELKGVPRRLSGFIIDVNHDIARITIGEAQGVRLDDVLDVMNVDENGEPIGDPLAQLKITYVEQRQSKGDLIRDSRINKIVTGQRVFAQKLLPIPSVNLPTAASSPAVADSRHLYVGAANQRLYSVEITTGFTNWQVMTPRTVTTLPIIDGDDLFYADQEGKVVSCTRLDKTKNWSYQTEGPIFVEMTLTPEYLFVASDDRSLYCLNRQTGDRVWRKQFDHAPTQAPRIADDHVYQHIPNEGLFALDVKTGKQIWLQKDGGKFLSQFEKNVYAFVEERGRELQRIDSRTGDIKTRVTMPLADYIVASQPDQLMVLVNRLGHAVCLRPKNAPALSPTDLAMVLRNDRKIAAARAAEAEAARTGKEAKEAAPIEDKPLPPIDVFGSDDWLSDHSGTVPVGGSGLINLGDAKPAAKETEKEGEKAPAKKPAKKDKDESDEDASDEDASESEDSEDEDGASDEEESGDEESSDDESNDDSDSDEESSDDEEGDESSDGEGEEEGSDDSEEDDSSDEESEDEDTSEEEDAEDEDSGDDE